MRYRPRVKGKRAMPKKLSDMDLEVELLRKELRRLRFLIVGVCALFGIALLGTARYMTESASFNELTVHRINIVDNDGSLRMVLANKNDFPPPMERGKPSGHRDNRGLAGILFYNDQGDESGGLVLKGKKVAGIPVAQSMLNFDDFESNEAVQLVYSRNGVHRSEGLMITQQSNAPIAAFRPAIHAALRLPKGSPARAAALAKLRNDGAFGDLRLFTGLTEDGRSLLYLADAKGRPRLAFVVSPNGRAKIEFLDKHGKVVKDIGTHG